MKELTKRGYQGVRTYQHNITDSLYCSTKSVRVLCGSVRVRRKKMVFDQTQRVFILEHYFGMQMREVFQEQFPNVDPPTKSVISRLVAKFRLIGVVLIDRERARQQS